MGHLLVDVCLRGVQIQRAVLVLFVSLLVASSSALAQSSSDDVHDEESGDEILAREQFFYERRAGGPGKVLPEDAFAKAVEEKRQMELSLRNSGTALPTGNWVSANPNGMFYARTGNNYISGRTNWIAFHPTNPSIMFAGAAGGGVWKTTNDGVQWSVLTDSLSSVTCGGLAVDPSNPNIIYYGTGELNFSLDSYYGDGVFKSTDGGTTWTKIATTAVGRYISQIAINPQNTNIVYLSGSNGVYKSTNAGATWATTNSGNNANCILIDPANPQVLFTTTGGSGGNSTRKSTDGGVTWGTAGTGLPGAGSAGRTQLAMCASNPNVLYASVASQSTSGLLGLYRTTDGGATWTLQNSTTNYLGSQGWYDNAVTVHPTNPEVVIVGGIDIYSSSNGGVTLTQRTAWATTNSSNMSHADIHFLGYNNGVLFCGSDGGVYKSTNDGVTWSDLNATLSTLQYQSADYDPTNPLRLYGGTQDNNLETSTDGGATWIQRTTGDGGYSVVDPVTPNYVYGQYVQGSIKRSNNYGVSFTDIQPNGSSGGLFYNPYEMAPTDHNTVVYGQADVWKTTSVQTATSSSGWTQIATTSVVGGSVSAIGIGADPNKIYVGTNNGRILVTTNNGGTWSALSGFPYVSDVWVENPDDNVCYMSCAGTTAGSHVFKTINGGASWTNITGNLPNTPVNTIVVRTAFPRMIFVGTDIGVFQSTNDGASWIPFNNGLPAATVYDLKYKENPNILMAATHGRGCFMYTDLPPLPGVRIVYSPSALDFGLVESGQASVPVNVEIQSGGSDTLTITSIANALPVVALTNVPPLPVRLPALGSMSFTVSVHPAAHGALTDTISISSNDPNIPVAKIAIRAKGVEIGRARPGIMYAVSTGGTSGELLTINTATGVATSVASTGIPEIDGLTVRPSTKELYGVFAGASGSTFFRISEAYGDALRLRSIALPNLRAIAFGRGDTLYGGTTNGRLYRISLSTGDTTYIGTASGIVYSSFAFSPSTNQLWASVRPPLVNRDKIYTVSTFDGTATLVGGTGDNAITPSIAFSPSGALFALKGTATQTNTLLAIDTLTGAGTLIGSTGVTGLQSITMRTDSLLTGVVGNMGIPVPSSYALHQNYPNPFNPTTRIAFDIPFASRVRLAVFDVVGREVAVLVDGWEEPGYKTVVFASNRFASGVYFYRLTAGAFVSTKKMIVTK